MCTHAIQNITAEWGDLGIAPATRLTVKDLWDGRELGTFSGEVSAADVPVHGVRLLRLSPA